MLPSCLRFIAFRFTIGLTVKNRLKNNCGLLLCALSCRQFSRRVVQQLITKAKGNFHVLQTKTCKSDVWLTVHRNLVWMRNQLDVTYVLAFISPLQISQHVSGNHVPIFRSWRLLSVIATCRYCSVSAGRLSEPVSRYCVSIEEFVELLNMFRVTMCPSSGADDCVVLSPRVGIVPCLQKRLSEPVSR